MSNAKMLNLYYVDNLEAYEVEDLLESILDTELNTKAEDNSLPDVRYDVHLQISYASNGSF